METVRHRDPRLLFKALLACLGLAIAWRVSLLFLAPLAPGQQEIRAEIRQIIPLRANDVAAQLRNADGKPTLLVIYASWCPYCRQAMPDIMELLKSHQLDNLHPLFISEDSSFSSLGAYLVRQHYRDAFVPYVVKQSGVNALADVLKRSGSHFTGFIPYAGFFDARGKMVAEFMGLVDKERLLEAAKLLHSSAS